MLQNDLKMLKVFLKNVDPDACEYSIAVNLCRQNANWNFFTILAESTAAVEEI
jgi:hypothetical protein